MLPNVLANGCIELWYIEKYVVRRVGVAISKHISQIPSLPPSIHYTDPLRLHPLQPSLTTISKSFENVRFQQ